MTDSLGLEEEKKEVTQPPQQVIFISTFKSSEHEKVKAVQEYLQERAADPYNKYCIDCKVNLSTHVMVMYGAFMCGSCANAHRQMFGFFQTYPKNITMEQFDDVQLASIAEQIGGNKAIYDLFVEYGILGEDSYSRFSHRCFDWYKRRLSCAITGTVFEEEKPPKNVGEALDYAGNAVSKFGSGVVDEIKSIDTTAIKSKLAGFWTKIRGQPQAAASHDAEPVPNLDSKDANQIQ